MLTPELFFTPLFSADHKWCACLFEANNTVSCDTVNKVLTTVSECAYIRDNCILFLPATSPMWQPLEGLKCAVIQPSCEKIPDLPPGLLTVCPIDPKLKFPPTCDADWYITDVPCARTVSEVVFRAFAQEHQLLLTGLLVPTDQDWAFNRLAMHSGAPGKKVPVSPLVSSEFLYSPQTASNNRHSDSNPLHIIRLLSLVSSDADTSEIEKILRQEPKITYILLHMVNSAAVSAGRTINSVGQAIMMLGRRTLQRWLQLLVYSGNKGEATPLLTKAAMRGYFMEQLAMRYPDQFNVQSEIAFMIGTFSLLDILLNLPMRDILAQLLPNPSLQAALGSHEGSLGTCVSAMNALANRQFAQAESFFKNLDIEAADFLELEIRAFNWACDPSSAS